MLVAHLYSLLVFLSFHDSLDIDAGQMDVFGSKRTYFHYLLHLGGREGRRERRREGGRGREEGKEGEGRREGVGEG